jgi:uncharacterized protein (DUF1015 family)
MANIKPFKAIRPTRDKVSLVASRSYLTYSKEALNDKLESNPFTFLHIINPDFSDKIKVNNQELKYQLVRKKFDSFFKQGVFKKEIDECYYIYQHSKNGKCYTGIIAGASMQDYMKGNIKIHEQTISKREKMFSDYLKATGFNAEPVLLTYKKNEEIDFLISSFTKQRPEYEFTTTNKVSHKLWIVDTNNEISKITEEFTKIKSLYIADGHHRMSSSSLLYSQSKGKKNAYCMSYLISDNQLSILNFNRLVKDLNGLSTSIFLEKLQSNFTLTLKSESFQPILEDEIGMYLNGKWYSLIYNPTKKKNLNVVDKLDPSILTDNILSPILGIYDLKTDKRISFIDGTNLDEAVKQVDNKDFEILFVLKSISIDTVKEVADKKLCMPPKSTYIEPKLRSGLIIYELDEY